MTVQTVVPKITTISTTTPMGYGAANQGMVPATSSAAVNPSPRSVPQPSSPQEQRATTSPLQPKATSQSAPTHRERAPEPAPNAKPLAPQGTITIEGSVTGIDLRSATPNVQLVMPNGTRWTLLIDSAKTVVRQGGQVVPLTDVQAGRSARISYGLEGEAHFVQTIDLDAAVSLAPNQTAQGASQVTAPEQPPTR